MRGRGRTAGAGGPEWGFAAVLRRFQTPAALPLCAGALMAVLAFGGAQVRAQSPNALDQVLMQPSLDGHPLIPLRRFPIVADNPFDPVGINAGAFRLRPAVEVSGGYDSRPARTATGSASWFAVVAPELSVNSLWARHELTAAVRSSYIDYDAVP